MKLVRNVGLLSMRVTPYFLYYRQEVEGKNNKYNLIFSNKTS